MRTLRLSLLPWLAGLVVAFGVAACGGEDVGRPSGERNIETEEVESCAGDGGYELLSFLDFEPAGRVLQAMGAGEVCDSCNNFYLNYDINLSTAQPTPLSVATNLVPPCPPGPISKTIPAGGMLPTETIPDGRCETSLAGFHIQAINIATCIRPETGRRGWGGSFEIQFGPYDASEWDGVGFWVKRGDGPSGSAIMFTVGDSYTAGQMPIEDPETGISRACNMDDPSTILPTPESTVPDSYKCDSFSIAITLPDEWTFLPLRFSDMRQKGYGLAAPLGRMDESRLVRLQLLFSSGDWDFWIDDISFFRDPG